MKSRRVYAGVPVGFKLAPAPTPPMYAHPTNEHARRGAFATKQLWVTPHSDDEKWPAGKYPLGGDMAGVEAWTSLVRPFLVCNPILLCSLDGSGPVKHVGSTPEQLGKTVKHVQSSSLPW